MLDICLGWRLQHHNVPIIQWKSFEVVDDTLSDLGRIGEAAFRRHKPEVASISRISVPGRCPRGTQHNVHHLLGTSKKTFVSSLSVALKCRPTTKKPRHSDRRLCEMLFVGNVERDSIEDADYKE